MGAHRRAVHKDYVLDYTSPLKNVIMEQEGGAGGLGVIDMLKHNKRMILILALCTVIAIPLVVFVKMIYFPVGDVLRMEGKRMGCDS